MYVTYFHYFFVDWSTTAEIGEKFSPTTYVQIFKIPMTYKNVPMTYLKMSDDVIFFWNKKKHISISIAIKWQLTWHFTKWESQFNRLLTIFQTNRTTKFVFWTYTKLERISRQLLYAYRYKYVTNEKWYTNYPLKLLDTFHYTAQM